jgi:hypothetical protein
MSGSPIKYLLQNRVQVLSAFTGSPIEAWKRLKDKIQIEKAMSENTFRALIKNFVEVCQYFEAGLNTGLNETIDGLNNQLNDRLNNQVRELNNRLNTLERLNEKLNNEIERLNNTEKKLNNMDAEQVKSRLNIEGWTIAKSGRYFRAFRKIKGRVVGIHLGLTLDGATEKIKEKAAQITGK